MVKRGEFRADRSHIVTWLTIAITALLPLSLNTANASEHLPKQGKTQGQDAGTSPLRKIGLGKKSLHFFYGAGASRFSQSGYAGVLAAPKGRLDKSGFRLRFEASGGLFQYQADLLGRTSLVETTIDGVIGGARAHIGYVFLRPRFGAGVFAGADFSHITTTPHDPGNDDIGTKISPALRLEGYAKPTNQLLVSAQASLKRDFQTRFARAALSMPIGWGMRFGPEALAFFAEEFLEMRYGAELLVPINNNRKIAVSGGYAVDSDSRSGGYGGLHFKLDY